MKDNIKELEKVVVKTKADLDKALVSFMTDTTIYKLLVEGMEIVKRQSEFTSVTISEEAFGGFMPAMPAPGGHYVWVDTLIDRRMNGKRDGLKVAWTVAEGKFEFDPWTRKLEQVSAQ